MTDEVPGTVRAALSGVPVAGATCLEAGAGAGGATLGLLAAGAERIVAVSNERSHVAAVRERAGSYEAGGERVDALDADDPDADDLDAADRDAGCRDPDDPGGDGDADGRTDPLLADLRSIPLPDDSVEVITAHALCNVLDPAALSAVAAELRRVAAPDAWLVVDDYAPSAAEGAVAELFAVENAASWLAAGRAAYTFYPAEMLTRAFDGFRLVDERTLLEPVPWTPALLDAHVDAARSTAERVDGEIGASLAERAEHVRAGIDGTVECGRMYGLHFRLE